MNTVKESKNITEETTKNNECKIIPFTPKEKKVDIKRLYALRRNIENFDRVLFLFKHENQKLGTDFYPVGFLEEEIDDLKFIAANISEILEILLTI